MTRLLVVLALLLLHEQVPAQRPPGAGGPQALKGSVQGILRDSVTQAPLEFASIGLLDPAGKAVNGALTDDKGAFRITDVTVGSYQLQVAYVGYAPKTVKGVELTPRKPDFDAGVILVSPEAQLLDEIQVVGEAALIEAKPDRIVYNAESDVTSRGGDASDVLRKVPLLAVDVDGNVSLRGSENVRILINGRPSGIFNGNVADALKMFPADQIKSVEVITSPSARYDGEGTAGIVNIITRRKSVEGLAGSAEATAGIRNSRANINLNYGRGRLSLNASGGGHYGYPLEAGSVFTRDEFGSAIPSYIDQDGANKSSRLGFRSFLGLEYQINAFNTVNVGLSYRRFNNQRENLMFSNYTENGKLVDQYERYSDVGSGRGGLDLEFDYRLTFPQKEREWTFAFQVNGDKDDTDSDYDTRYAFPLEASPLLQQNVENGNDLDWTFQTDYVHPLSPAVKLEAGAKAVLRNIRNDFRFEQYNLDVNAWIPDPQQTDVFTYNQNVFAGYLSTVIRMGDKYTLLAGGRLEGTHIDGDFERFEAPFANDYVSFLPSVTLSRIVGRANQLKIGYTERIQRPSQRHVNPFIEYNDNRDITYGNPELAPERMHQIELGSNWFLKGGTLNLSVFARRTYDLIESLVRVDENGVSETTYQNFGRRDALGTNVFGSVTIGEWLTVRGGIDFNYWYALGTFDEQSLDNTGIDLSGRINLTWNITKTLRAEGFAFLRSPTYTVQGKNPNWSMMSFAIRKEWPEKRLTLGLNITEPFRENLAWEREIFGTTFYQYSNNLRPVRSIGVTAGYRFGKLDFKDRSGRRKINNNDQKESGTGENF